MNKEEKDLESVVCVPIFRESVHTKDLWATSFIQAVQSLAKKTPSKLSLNHGFKTVLITVSICSERWSLRCQVLMNSVTSN